MIATTERIYNKLKENDFLPILNPNFKFGYTNRIKNTFEKLNYLAYSYDLLFDKNNTIKEAFYQSYTQYLYRLIKYYENKGIYMDIDKEFSLMWSIDLWITAIQVYEKNNP